MRSEALAKLLAKLGEYMPTKKQAVASGLTGLGIGTPIALLRESAMEEQRAKDLWEKTRRRTHSYLKKKGLG
jgi:hypothetical protein